jgi:hypothetical protein
LEERAKTAKLLPLNITTNMKNSILIFLLFLSSLLSAQCDTTLCAGDALTLSHTTTAQNPTFFWDSPIAFSGQNTGSIIIAGMPIGSFNVTLTITDGVTGCVNSDTISICVIQGVASLNLPEICEDSPCIPIVGGTGSGTYFINNVPVTQLCPSDAGQTVTFVSTGNCPGTATDVFAVNPKPSVTIIPQ